MINIVADVRHGMRRLRRSPGFTATALLTLALGIGATTAIFTLAYQVILKAMPVQHPEQLYKVGKESECCIGGGDQGHWSIFSYDIYRTIRERVGGMADMTAMQAGAARVSAHRQGDTYAQPLDIRHVAGNYFEVLGVNPYAGRMLTADDDREGAPIVAVISYAIWKSKFHSDPGIVGDTVIMTGHPVTIVGIAQKDFLGERNMSDPPGVWIPLAQEPIFNPTRKLYKAPNGQWLRIMLRIPEKKNVPIVESAVRSGLTAWLMSNPDVRSGHTLAEIARESTELAPAADGINELRDSYETSLLMLQWTAAFVLLIACANLANLMLVRGVARRQELSVRAALGASRVRLVREMLIEAMLLALMGGVMGIGVAYLGVKGMLALAMRGVTIMPLSPLPSLPVLAFSIVASTMTGILFGIAPAFIASNADPADALRAANRATGNSGGLQRALVILQTALSVALLSIAGLFLRSLQRLEHQDLRFETTGRLIAFIDLPAAGYTYPRLEGLYRHLEQTFAAAPALHDMAYATYGPMTFMGWATGVNAAGPHPERTVSAGYSLNSPRYFSAIGTPLLQGRTFTEHDNPGSRHVAIVNREFVHQVLQDAPALGMHFGPGVDMAQEYEIVGVVDDAKYGDPSRGPQPMYFIPMSQITTFNNEPYTAAIIDQSNKAAEFKHFAANIIVRYEGDSAAAAVAMRHAIEQVDPGIPVTRITTYQDQISNSFTQRQLVVRLTAIFGGLALLLASVGLYGVTAYAVARRIPEIGLRIALGADRSQVMSMILRGALLQTAAGLLLGAPIAFLSGHYLQSQLYQVSGYDPAIFLLASAALILSAFVASVIPARMASNTDPIRALRME